MKDYVIEYIQRYAQCSHHAPIHPLTTLMAELMFALIVMPAIIAVQYSAIKSILVKEIRFSDG